MLCSVLPAEIKLAPTFFGYKLGLAVRLIKVHSYLILSTPLPQLKPLIVLKYSNFTILFRLPSSLHKFPQESKRL